MSTHAARRDSDDQAQLAALYADRVAGHDALRPGYAAQFTALTGALLQHGGTLVVPPPAPEPRAALIAQGMTVWTDPTLRYDLGEPSHCHSNTAELWLAGAVEAIVTGYGLTADDGLWRQHTWGLDAAGTVVETTVGRDVYAGVILDEVGAWHFAAANVDVTEAQIALERLRRLGPVQQEIERRARAALANARANRRTR